MTIAHPLYGYTEFHWKNLTLTGNDAVAFFHRIVTQDLVLQREMIWTSFSMTDRMGMLLFTGYAFKSSSTSLLLCYQAVGTNKLEDVLKGYKIREAVTWSTPEPLHVTMIWSEDKNKKCIPFENWKDQLEQGTQSYAQFRNNSPIIFTFHEVNWDKTFYKNANDQQWERVRITHGIPRIGHEIIEKKIPFEIGLSHTINLSKGCYPGQETIVKFAHRGNYPRQLCVLSAMHMGTLIPSKGWMTSDLSIVTESGHEIQVGTITSSVLKNMYQITVLVIARRSSFENKKASDFFIQVKDVRIPVTDIEFFP